MDCCWGLAFPGPFFLDTGAHFLVSGVLAMGVLVTGWRLYSLGLGFLECGLCAEVPGASFWGLGFLGQGILWAEIPDVWAWVSEGLGLGILWDGCWHFWGLRLLEAGPGGWGSHWLRSWAGGCMFQWLGLGS